MQLDVREYIKKCDVCQRYKYFKLQTPTQRVPAPINIFKEVSLDAVGPVPSSSSGNTCILATQDRLSRWILFTPMPDQSVETTVRAFLTKWICTYGVPRKVFTDRGSNFVSELFQELHKFLGIKPINTCAYRPQGNGMNERTHKELHEYLAMYLRPANRQTWDTMLNVASWIHNSTEHEALGMSPFEIMTGVKPRSAQSWIPTQGENIKEINEKFQHYYNVDRKYLEELREKAKVMIGKAQTDYLTRLNKYSKEMRYKIGDKVLIRIQDRSTYVSRKWSAKYKGPYIVKAIIGPGVVKIQDEETGYTNLIHVVYLRPYNEKSPPPSKEEDSGIQSMDIEQTPFTDPNKKKRIKLPAGTSK
jgi:hypothetical protein